MIRPHRLYTSMAIAVLCWLPQPPSFGADAQRGQLLYENHCTVCHTSVAHVREQRVAHSLGDIRKQVLRWSGQLNLEWRAEEVADVVEYLNTNYYHFESQ